MADGMGGLCSVLLNKDDVQQGRRKCSHVCAASCPVCGELRTCPSVVCGRAVLTIVAYLGCWAPCSYAGGVSCGYTHGQHMSSCSCLQALFEHQSYTVLHSKPKPSRMLPRRRYVVQPVQPWNLVPMDATQPSQLTDGSDHWWPLL